MQQGEALDSGRINIAFCRIRLDDPAIFQEVLREDRRVAVLPSGHALAGQPLSLEQLAGEALILYPGHPRPSYKPTSVWSPPAWA